MGPVYAAAVRDILFPVLPAVPDGSPKTAQEKQKP
jgi:hypothetical protein